MSLVVPKYYKNTIMMLFEPFESLLMVIPIHPAMWERYRALDTKVFELLLIIYSITTHIHEHHFLILTLHDLCQGQWLFLGLGERPQRLLFIGLLLLLEVH